MPAALTEDREIRPLLRRIHRLPRRTSGELDITDSPKNEAAEDGADQLERDMTRLEVMKWKIGLERIMASARNLQKQAERYRQRAAETSVEAEMLESTLENEKKMLAQKLVERDQHIKCDEVYARISARPKTREELEEQITILKAQISTDQTSHQNYLDIVQRRIDAFAGIMPILEEVRKIKLPAEIFPVDEEAAASSTAEGTPSSLSIPTGPKETASDAERPHLSGAALPFQPSSSASTSSATAPGGRASTVIPSLPPPPPSPRTSSHNLPSRPSRKSPGLAPQAPGGGSGRNAGRASSANLPSRPSNLRKSATPGKGLEEGEVEGQEEGEVRDRRTGRNVRQRVS